jgi:hypothetical protein
MARQRRQVSIEIAGATRRKRNRSQRLAGDKAALMTFPLTAANTIIIAKKASIRQGSPRAFSDSTRCILLAVDDLPQSFRRDAANAD